MAGSARSRERERERQCAVTRERRAPDDLLRFALDPEGTVVPDLKSRLPGRGVWVSCDARILARGIENRAFDRHFRQQVTAGKDLVGLTAQLLERDCLQRLSLANKAGAVICGFDKTSETVKRGDARALLHASDASDDGCKKLDRQFSAVARASDGLASTVRNLNREQLSLALGRSNVVHAALKHGVPAEKFIAASLRLGNFRAGSKVENSAQVPETEEE